MLDLIATVTLVCVPIFSIGALAVTMPGALPGRLGLLAIGGLWTGLATAVAGSGALLGNGLGPIPPVGIFTATPLIAAAIAAAMSPSFRATVMALPTSLLIGLNTWRLLGVLFLLLAAAGRIGGPFPYVAGIGDIITGALALPIAASLARGGAAGARAWNLFGALDLVVAVALAATSAEGAPLQIFHTGISGPLPLQTLPYALVPTVLVPLGLILHGVLYAQLRRSAPAGSGLAVAAR